MNNLTDLNNENTASESISARITQQDVDHINNLKNIMDKDFATIDNLVNWGGLQAKQGQALKNEVLKKVFAQIKPKFETSEKPQNQPAEPSSEPLTTNEPQQSETPQAVTEQFINEADAEFLKKPWRTSVTEYLKQNAPKLTKNEIKTVLELVKNVESSAIQDFQAQEEMKKILSEQNELAKQKLVSSVNSGNSAPTSIGKTFTKEEIARMTPEEFNKNDKAIAEQIIRGYLK